MSVFAFDAYGTLFDIHTAVRRNSGEIGGNASALSEMWRQKQLEYAFVRALARRYTDFWSLTCQALDTAMERFGLTDALLRKKLLDSYLELDAFAEVPAVLQALRADGARLVILSNGAPEMLGSALAASGLKNLFDEVLSADAVETFKCDPAIYASLAESCHTAPSALTFVSSNRWDIAGAAAFGFHAIWVNRSGAPEEYADLAPQAVIADLTGLLTAKHRRNA